MTQGILLPELSKLVVGSLALRYAMREMSDVVLDLCAQSGRNEFFDFDVLLNGSPFRRTVLSLRTNFFLTLDDSLEAVEHAQVSVSHRLCVDLLERVVLLRPLGHDSYMKWEVMISICGFSLSHSTGLNLTAVTKITVYASPASATVPSIMSTAVSAFCSARHAACPSARASVRSRPASTGSCVRSRFRLRPEQSPLCDVAVLLLLSALPH